MANPPMAHRSAPPITPRRTPKAVKSTGQAAGLNNDAHTNAEGQERIQAQATENTTAATPKGLLNTLINTAEKKNTSMPGTTL